MDDVRVVFFPNGNTALFKDGAEVSCLEEPWVVVFAEFLAKNGVNPLGAVFVLPNDRTVRILRTANGGYSYTLEERSEPAFKP